MLSLVMLGTIQLKLWQYFKKRYFHPKNHSCMQFLHTGGLEPVKQAVYTPQVNSGALLLVRLAIFTSSEIISKKPPLSPKSLNWNIQ